MNIYIICPVRKRNEDRLKVMRKYAHQLRNDGHQVHFPPDDAPQDDPTGALICAIHLAAMQTADEVHVFWDAESYGSHFDLGMAYALRKTIVPVSCEKEDVPEKSYWKAVIAK